jgi:3-deoxy-manno-octulosonate cytidylyltransferase (CMP-KDO synthetase)
VFASNLPLADYRQISISLKKQPRGEMADWASQLTWSPKTILAMKWLNFSCMENSMSNPQRSEKCLLVIPARRRSTRLPNKMLLRETGKTVLQHTYEAASQARIPGSIVIATDDEEIAAEAQNFGAQVAMTSPDCPSGTDRVAEVVRGIPEAEIVVNLQGDEPEIDRAAIDRLATLLIENPTASMATLATPIRSREALEDPACVKVVFDNSRKAMYFSRSPIPHPREWNDDLLTTTPATFYQHIGIYAYRRNLLLRFASLPMGQTEQIEKLEQLRILEQGETILVSEVAQPTRGIDTPADYAAFVTRLNSQRFAA